MSRTIAIVIRVALTITGAGCYGAALPAPAKAELPQLVDGATLELDVASSRYWSSSRSRYVTDTEISGITYGNIPLTYHEARSLADPTWDGKLDDYRSLVKRCRRANVPRYLGYATIALGILAYAGGSSVFQDNTELQATVGASLIGFGTASYAAGYLFLGGQACREAASVAGELNLRGADSSKLDDPDLMLELARIADAFNKRMRARREPVTAAGAATKPGSP